MLNAHLAELEQEFRKQWQGYQPHAYAAFLEQVAPEDETALLARLLAVELEYAYQPPNLLDHIELGEVDDDERVEPRVTLFLHRFPQLRAHRELLIQLVMLEFALRLRFDPQTPNYDSYLDLCPNEKERIGSMMQVMEEKLYRLGGTRNLLGPSTQDDTTVAESASEKQITFSQLPCSLGYFLLTDVIGQGGMGTVYNAVDLRSAAHVAVKIINRADPWSVYRFIEEFTWLSTLNHPNVVKLYDTFSEGDTRYFSMEVVEGQSIRDWFQAIGPVDRWGQLRRVLSQAALAVAFLHNHEVIHRDIKSSNLMITGRGRAVLLDLGLASRMHGDSAGSADLDGQQIIGTLHYISPEALHGREPGFASDWYSFGVMMYETMTGSFPPVRIDMQAALDSGQRFRLDYAASTQHLAHCPNDLAELCLEMLRTDPLQRPRASEIIRRLGSDVGQPIPFVVNESDFVGRERGLEMLESGLAQARAGHVSLRLVRGESGLGKSTLLNRWLKSLQPVKASSSAQPTEVPSESRFSTKDILRLCIRCHSQDHTPLRALNLLVQELVTCLAKEPRELWADLARGGGEEIVYTFPQMERLGSESIWAKKPRAGDAMEGVARRAAGLHALLEWLKGLSRRRPLVLTIDDAQWADEESGRILSCLLRSSSEFRGLIVLVDQGQQVHSPFLQRLLEETPERLSDETVYEIPPLPRNQCQQLLACWSERLNIQLTDEVAADILNRSGGSPFLLQELLRSYVNYIVRHRLSDETWLSGSPKSAGVLHNRFSMLPVSTEKVLQFLAVSTQPLGIHQLQTVTRILPGQLLAELNHLSGQGWIRFSGTMLDSEVEISHERFREVVLQSMMEDRLQRRHYRLARMLSSEVPPPWRRIAHHYSEARQHREAAACYMEGARAAAKRLSFAESLWMLERAFHPQAQRTEQEVQSAQRLKADCLAGHGNALAAAHAYEQLAQSPESDQNLMQCLAGEQWIRAGRLAAGLEALRSLLKQLKVQVEPSEHAWSWWSSWQLLRYRTIRPSLACFKPTETPLSEIEQCLNSISGPLQFLDGQLGRRLTARLFQLSLERGSSTDRALAVMRWTLMLFGIAQFSPRRAVGWIAVARQLVRNSNSQNARARIHVCLFVWHSLRGRFATALRYARRGELAYAAHYAADTWETGFVCWVSLSHLWYLGRLRELCERTDAYRQDAARRTDTMWTYWMHVNAAHAADLVRDDVAAARQALHKAGSVLSEDQFELPQVMLWVSHVRQLLYEGDFLGARACLIQRWSDLERSGILRVSYYQWLIRYLRAICELACAYTEHASAKTHLRQARHQCARLLRLRESTFLIYAQALQLAIGAAEGRIATGEQWQAVLQAARHRQLNLLALAVEWHAEIWHPTGFVRAIRSQLADEGCLNPLPLMNLVLPLPPADLVERTHRSHAQV